MKPAPGTVLRAAAASGAEGLARPALATGAPGLPAQALSPVDRAAAALVALEAEIRQARTIGEIHYFAANEPRLLTRAQQIFVLGKGRRGRLEIMAISAVTAVDRAAPLVAGMEALVAALSARHGLNAPRAFELAGQADETRAALDGYPLTQLLWVPYADMRGEVVGGALQARTTPWTEADIAIAGHIAGSVSRSLLATAATGRRWHWSQWIGRKTLAGLVIAVLALMLVPVSMSALAPVEVVPRNAFIVTAGGTGVVETVPVDSNAPVKSGDVLVILEDTELRNRLEIAEHEVGVAQAGLKKARQLAFVDQRGKHDLAVAEADLEVKRAERDFAQEMLDRSVVKADRDGVVVFGAKSELIGKPVSAGEKLMEIVDPEQVELRIDLPVSETIVLKPDARISVFLDSDPLSRIEARMLHADYKARVDEQQKLAFRIQAEVPGDRPMALRLGVRGTAQIASDKVSLGFYLLRRPLAALRQWIGL